MTCPGFTLQTNPPNKFLNRNIVVNPSTGQPLTAGVNNVVTVTVHSTDPSTSPGGWVSVILWYCPPATAVTAGTVSQVVAVGGPPPAQFVSGGGSGTFTFDWSPDVSIMPPGQVSATITLFAQLVVIPQLPSCSGIQPANFDPLASCNAQHMCNVIVFNAEVERSLKRSAATPQLNLAFAVVNTVGHETTARLSTRVIALEEVVRHRAFHPIHQGGSRLTVPDAQLFFGKERLIQGGCSLPVATGRVPMFGNSGLISDEAARCVVDRPISEQFSLDRGELRQAILRVSGSGFWAVEVLQEEILRDGTWAQTGGIVLLRAVAAE